MLVEQLFAISAIDTFDINIPIGFALSDILNCHAKLIPPFLAEALRAAPPVQPRFPLMPWARCPGRRSAARMVARGGDEEGSTGRGVRSGPDLSHAARRAGVPRAFFAKDWAGERMRGALILPILNRSIFHLMER